MNGIDMYQSMELIDDRHIEEALCAKPVKRHAARRVVLKTAAMAAAVFLAFVTTINIFPVTACALSSIPVLGDIARAVTVDPSMKECLAHSYVQYVGESQTVDGYHSEVYCMVVDASRISVFFTSDVPSYPENEGEAYFTVERITDNEGNEFSSSWGINETDTENLYECRVDMGDGEPIPDSLRFRIQYFTAAGYSDEVASAEYTLYPDKQYSTVVKSYEVNSKVEIMGQIIHIDRLDVYPTQAKLYFRTDEANTALLKDIAITLVDETGRTYPQRSNGTIGTGSGNGDVLSRWYESPYFGGATTLTAEITAVSFLDKNAQFGTVDYANKTISHLPAGVSVASMILDDNDTLEIALKVPDVITSQVFSITYRDSKGKEYASSSGYQWTSVYFAGYPNDEIHLEEEGYEYQVISIANYRKDTYQVEWLYAPGTALETPIVIPVFD